MSSDYVSGSEIGQLRHRHRRTLDVFEWLTLLHVAVFAAAAAWAFGGQADWVRGPLAVWGSLGGGITLAALLNGDVRRRLPRLAWTWLLPVAAFNAVVILAAENPSFTAIRSDGELFYATLGARENWPSSAVPHLAREALWLFDGAWLSCLNLAFVVRHRRALRLLLGFLVANALLLAVFGTAQRLLHAKGLFFDLVPSPQKYFFASFVYHNHWGAFTLLSMAAALALVSHYGRLRSDRGLLHSPTPTGLVVVLLLAATIPLSASRSSTVLATVLLGGAFLHWMWREVQKRRELSESIIPPIAVAALAVLLGVSAIGYLARDTIVTRYHLTLQQVQDARKFPDARLLVYRDTWRMAKDKPWFGWGMASYPHVFTLYNSRTSPDRRPLHYHDAHNDWLQAVSEHGFIGTALLILTAAVPLGTLRRRAFSSPFSRYLLAGCGIVVLYATLEFPFGNFAVVLTWWLCFFAALQYGYLTWKKNAQEGATPK